MDSTHRIQRVGSVTAAAAAVMLVTIPGRAADKPKATAACNTAGQYVHAAHASEAAGHTAEAIDAYRSCAEQTGCGWLALKCDAKIKLLQGKLPTIVLVANDENGQPIADVEVRVDGILRTSKLNGVGLPIEPGLHELSFSAGSGVFATEKLMVVEGQHDRLVTITMHSQGGKSAVKSAAPSAVTVAPPAPDSASTPDKPPAQTETPPPASAPAEEAASTNKSASTAAVSDGPSAGPTHWAMPRSPLPYTLAGVGVVGIAGGVLTTVWGNKDNSNLVNKCSPYCQTTSVDHIKTLYYVSDVSYGVGIAALGVATWMFASSRSAEKAPSATAAVVGVGVQPLPSGAFASVSGRF
ncbi:MAG TPA: hypothetical protein VEK07_23715 [Polyangiaceae bacterium]|nr:hypothetical protein [Polyangiaceae bacterium]